METLISSTAPDCSSERDSETRSPSGSLIVFSTSCAQKINCREMYFCWTGNTVHLGAMTHYVHSLSESADIVGRDVVPLQYFRTLQLAPFVSGSARIDVPWLPASSVAKTKTWVTMSILGGTIEFIVERACLEWLSLFYFYTVLFAPQESRGELPVWHNYRWSVPSVTVWGSTWSGPREHT